MFQTHVPRTEHLPLSETFRAWSQKDWYSARRHLFPLQCAELLCPLGTFCWKKEQTKYLEHKPATTLQACARVFHDQITVSLGRCVTKTGQTQVGMIQINSVQLIDMHLNKMPSNNNRQIVLRYKYISTSLAVSLNWIAFFQVTYLFELPMLGSTRVLFVSFYSVMLPNRKAHRNGQATRKYSHEPTSSTLFKHAAPTVGNDAIFVFGPFSSHQKVSQKGLWQQFCGHEHWCQWMWWHQKLEIRDLLQQHSIQMHICCPDDLYFFRHRFELTTCNLYSGRAQDRGVVLQGSEPIPLSKLTSQSWTLWEFFMHVVWVEPCDVLHWCVARIQLGYKGVLREQIFNDRSMLEPVPEPTQMSKTCARTCAMALICLMIHLCTLC